MIIIAGCDLNILGGGIYLILDLARYLAFTLEIMYVVSNILAP